MHGFLHRPRSTRVRQVLFQIHLWVGVCAGLYLVVIGVTGAALVFRQDMQAARYPQFFQMNAAAGEPHVSVTTLVGELQRAYPDHRLSGIDWPTDRRGTFLAYVTRGGEFRTVFSDPRSGRVTGELPVDVIRWLQELHFNLLSGPTGRVANGVGAACLLVMCVTGLPIWWRGLARWRQGLRVGMHRGWRRFAWELHGAAGVWLWGLLVVWGATGVYFAYPAPFRQLVNAVSPLTVVGALESGPRQDGRPSPDPEAVLALARRAVPDAAIARLVLPSAERATFLVVMARATHGDYDTSDEVSVYVDRYTGRLLQVRDHGTRTAGDTLMAWIGPLHVGAFGGMAVRLLWALAGLALPLLLATGCVMWWTRTRNDT